jgi:uncharacterized protein YxjI
MRYIMKQKILSLTDSFTIQDADGNPVYEVKGKLLSIGDRLDFHTMDGQKVASIRQKVLSIKTRYFIYRNGQKRARMKKRRFTLIRDKFRVDVFGAPDLEIVGSVLEHNYRFVQQGQEVARVSKQWVSLSDSYGVDVRQGMDDVLFLACAVVVDLMSHD